HNREWLGLTISLFINYLLRLQFWFFLFQLTRFPDLVQNEAACLPKNWPPKMDSYKSASFAGKKKPRHGGATLFQNANIRTKALFKPLTTY
ncbi:MAG: hypothetical protein PHS80_15755, partial [Methanothrix sp.]|nr:hypothetical protein [Methanothrix sp.]